MSQNETIDKSSETPESPEALYRVFSIPGINDRHAHCWRHPEFAQEVALDEVPCNFTRILDPETEVDVLSNEARAVLDDILSKLEASPGCKPIILYAYDVGGLVLKQAMVIARTFKYTYSPVLDRLKLVVFFGTPHHLPTKPLDRDLFSLCHDTNCSKDQCIKFMDLYNHYYHSNLAANEILAHVKIINVFQSKGLTQALSKEEFLTTDLPLEEWMALSTDHTSLGYLETGDDRLYLRRQLEQCNPAFQHEYYSKAIPLSGKHDIYIRQNWHCKGHFRKVCEEVFLDMGNKTPLHPYIFMLPPYLYHTDFSHSLLSYLRDTSLKDRRLFLSATIDTRIEGRVDIRSLLHCLCIQLLSLRPSLWAACRPFSGALEAFTTVAPPEEYMWRFLNTLILSSEDAIVCVLDLVHAQFEHQIVLPILARFSSILDMGKATVKFIFLLEAKDDFSSLPGVRIGPPDGNWDLINEQMIESRIKSLLEKRPEMAIVEDDIATGCSVLLHDWSLIDSFLSSIETLSWTSIGSVKSLAKLFEQPDECFQYILGSVPESERGWIQIALVWLSFSVRPLSPRELGTAVLATLSFQDIEEAAKERGLGPDIPITMCSLNPERVSFDMCHFLPALVEVVRGKVRLINQHIRDYLELRGMENPGHLARGEQWYQTQHSHLLIAESSLSYLYECLFSGLDKPRDIAQTPPGVVQLGTDEETRMPIEYVVQNWDLHLRKHEALSSHVSEKLTRLLNDCKLMASWSCWKHSLDLTESQKLPKAGLQSPLEISRFYCIPLSAAVQAFDTAFLAQSNSDWKLDFRALLALQLKNGAESIQHITKIREDAQNTQNIDFTIIMALKLGIASFDSAKRTLEDAILLDNASDILPLEVSRGNHEAIHYICSKCPKAFVDITKENITTLHRACLYGYPQLVQWLCDNTRVLGLSWVNQQNSDGYKPLHIATEHGHFDIVKMLVARQADLIDRGPASLNALSIAAKKGLTQILKYFLAKGVSCHATDDDGRTPLHHASIGGFVEITRALLANGAIWNQPDCNKDNALHLAIRNRRQDVSLSLLDAIQQNNQFDRDAIQPVGLDYPGSDEKSPLHAAVDADLGEIVLAISKVRVSLGFERPRDVLTRAASRDLGSLVDELLAAGLDPAEEDENRKSPLDVAALYGADNVVEVLLKHHEHCGVTGGATISSALHKAAVSGHLKTTKRLLGLINGQYDIDTLNQVVINGHTEVAMVLLKGDYPNRPTELGRILLSCAQFEQNVILDFLLENRVDKDFQDENGKTALHVAASWNKPEIMKSLLSQQANMELKDRSGYTALLAACKSQSLASLEILLKAGADIEADTNLGKTPLRLSAEHEDIGCFRVLLEWGAKPAGSTFLEYLINTKDAGWAKMLLQKTKGEQLDRHTPGFQKAFTLAVHKGDSYVEVVESFLEYGVDVNALYQDEPVLVTAAYKGHVQIVDRLINHPTNSADVNKPGGRFGSAIYAAVAYPDLPDYDATMPIVTEEDRSRIFDLLLDKGATVRPIYDQYGTIMHAAAIYSSDDMVAHILGRGKGKWTMLDPDWEARTPLHILAYRNQLTLASGLLESNAVPRDSLFNKDVQGRTVVHFAAAGGALAFLKWLKDVGGQDIVTSPDYDGWTPLHWACRWWTPSNAEWLIQQGASVTAKTVEGWTPEDVAIYHDNDHFIPYFCNVTTSEKLLSYPGYKFRTMCESCFKLIYGRQYHCQRCFMFYYCFKCYDSYSRKQLGHIKEHSFIESLGRAY